MVLVHCTFEERTFDIDLDPNGGWNLLKIQILSKINVNDDIKILVKNVNGMQQGLPFEKLQWTTDAILIVTRNQRHHNHHHHHQNNQQQQQQYVHRIHTVHHNQLNKQQQLQLRLSHFIRNMQLYELVQSQNRARECIPIMQLEQKARCRHQEYLNDIKNNTELKLATSNNNNNQQNMKKGYREFLLESLVEWFKNDFFSWINTPKCIVCDNKTTSNGYEKPTPEDLKYGANRIEKYICSEKHTTLFPRYNNAIKLLETRKGRCGEYAQCFALISKSFNFDVRIVYDWTDHVWCEIYSENNKRWLHCDPCENRIDRPLMYEQGWNKKLTYVFGVAYNSIVDVTRRYTNNYKNEVLKRRHDYDEIWLNDLLLSINKQLQSKMNDTNKNKLVLRLKEEQEELLLLEEKSRQLHDEENQGRISGNIEWKINRGEEGKQEQSIQRRQTIIKPYIPNFQCIYKNNEMIVPCGPLFVSPMYGKRHSDTIFFSGKNELIKLNHEENNSNIDNNQYKLYKIRIWSNIYVHAIQQIWVLSQNNNIKESVISGNITNECVLNEVILDNNEYICAVWGRNGDILDSLTIVTTKNKKYSFGKSTSGDFFQISMPSVTCNVACNKLRAASMEKYVGNVVIAFNYGTGGHLHCIGVCHQAVPKCNNMLKKRKSICADHSKRKKEACELFILYHRQIKNGGCRDKKCKICHNDDNNMNDNKRNSYVEAMRRVKAHLRGKTTLCNNNYSDLK